MEAKYIKPINQKNKIELHRKANNFYSEYVLYGLEDLPNPYKIITVRFYTTATNVYCCVWTHTSNFDFTSGSSKAGGYGYHKGSAAFEYALNDAGFTFDKAIAGIGEQAITKALEAIAKLAGYENILIHYAHA